MDFPTGQPEPTDLTQFYQALADAFKFNVSSIVETEFCSKTSKLIVVLKNLKEVLASLVPTTLTCIQFPVNVRGIILATSNLEGAKDQYKHCDFASRYFAPWVGIPEDPVCGTLLV